MRSRKKNFLAMGLAVLMMLQILPINVFATERETQTVVKEAIDYALFSASQDSALSISYSKANITGNVYSNADFVYKGSNLIIEGTCKTSGIIDVKDSKAVITNKVEGASIVEMQDYNEDIRSIANEDAEIFTSDKRYNGSNIVIQKSIIAGGNISVNGSKLTSNGYVIAEKDISFNSARTESAGDKGIVICSEKGNITFTGANVNLKGIIYAPKGTVTINSANFNLNGRIIADKIVCKGSSLNVISSDEDIELIKYRKPALIKLTSDSDTLLANGTEKVTISVKVEDKYGDPVSDERLFLSSETAAVFQTEVVMDDEGQAEFDITSLEPEQIKITAKTSNDIYSVIIIEAYIFNEESGAFYKRARDDLGNIFELTGGDIVKYVKVKSLTTINLEEIMDTDHKLPIYTYPVMFEVPEDLEDVIYNNIQVKTKLNQMPDLVLNIRMEDEVLEWTPFYSDEELSEISFNINQTAIILPVEINKNSNEQTLATNNTMELCKRLSGLTLASADNSFNFSAYINLSSTITTSASNVQKNYKKPFNIIQNDNGNIKIELTYFIENPYDDGWLQGDPEFYYNLYKIELNNKDKEIETVIKNKEYISNNNLLIAENLENGVYKIKVYEEETGFDDLIWIQDIFIEKDPTISANQIEELAKKHAPILVFHKDEEYFPISFDELFNADINEQVGLKDETFGFSTIFGGEKVPYKDLKKFMPYNGHSKYLINGNNSLGLQNVKGSVENSTVYYSYYERDNRIFINYHFIYAFDPKHNDGVAKHNFDRESITISFDKHSKEPQDVIISGHLPDQKMALIGSDNIWTGGRVSISFDKMIKYFNHPIIAVAKGAHALYPVSGLYLVDDKRVPSFLDLKEPSGLMEYLSVNDFNQEPKPNVNGKKILLPRNSDFDTSGFNSYKISKLKLSQASNGDVPYIVFSGDWVDIIGTDNEKFPPFTKKEKFIENWVDDAHTCWDWSKITQDAKRSIRDINVYLAKQLLKSPQNLTKTENASTVTLSWDSVKGADAYIIYNYPQYPYDIIWNHSAKIYASNSERITYEHEIDRDAQSVSYWVTAVKFIEPVLSLNDIETIYFSPTTLESGNSVESEASNTVKIHNNNGEISGLVLDAITNNSINNASVSAYDRSNSLRNTTSSNNTGQYTINLSSDTGYKIVVDKSGYIPVEYHGIDISENEHIYLETVLQIPNEYINISNGVVKGIITRADNGSVVNGVTIKLRNNLNNRTGDVIKTTLTTSNGSYIFNDLKTGYYTAEVSAPGYITTYFNVHAIGGREVVKGVAITPKLLSGQIRIVLEWGASPRDLDSHLTGPELNGGRYHVYYSNRTYSSSGTTYAQLDRDDTDSYGPETITMTINNVGDGLYRYSVHDYTNRSSTSSTALSFSGAKVKVYIGDEVKEFNVPQNRVGTLWEVFVIENGVFKLINEMTSHSSPSTIR